MGNFPNCEGGTLFGVLERSNQIHEMLRSKAFSARPVYFRCTVKSRPDIAMDLCHGKKMLTK
jgi:hypothetical protein